MSETIPLELQSLAATKLMSAQFLHRKLCMRSFCTPVSTKEARMVAFYERDTERFGSRGKSVELDVNY